jgi:hypothetical protein
MFVYQFGEAAVTLTERFRLQVTFYTYIPASTPVILTEIFRGFLQSILADARLVEK